MKSSKSKSRTSRSSKPTPRQSSLTPKHDQINSLLSPKQKKPDKKLEEKFINSHSQLRSPKTSKRLIAKTERQKEFTTFNPNSKKKLRSKSQEDTEAIVSTLKTSVKPKKRHTLKKLINDGKKLNDLVQKPDIDCINEVLSRITPKHLTQKPAPKTLIEKTKLLVKQKPEKQVPEGKLDPQASTHSPSPPACKSKVLHKKSKSTSSLLPKPSIPSDPIKSIKPIKPCKPIKPSKPSKVQLVEPEGPNIISKQPSTSPPSKSHKRVPSYLPVKGTFISSTLGKLSPGKVPGKEEISARMLQLSQKLS